VAGEVGVTQFLKLGTAVAQGEDIHEIALDAAPATTVPRVVYVGSDPVVLAHAHRLRRGSPEGTVAYVHGTLRDPDSIVRQASETLDLSLPLAILLPATLNFVPDESDPYGIVARLVAAIAPGSYLAIAHATHDPARERRAEAAERFSKMLGEPYVLRSAAEIGRFFDGLDLVGPGVGGLDRWYPPGSAASAPPVEPGRPVPLCGAVGRKP
jgi:hypothetical protein